MLVSNQKTFVASLAGSFRGALDFLLPARCPGCSRKLQAHGFLCPDCWGTLSPLAQPYCTRCALPFEFETEVESACGACLKRPPAFDWARSAVLYDALGRSLVLRLKHGGGTAYVPAMAKMMAGAGAETSPDIIMPVPLHGRRLLARRFNQSQLLGKALAAELNLPLDCFSLVKKRPTKSQGGLNRKERFRNVESSFTVTKNSDLSGKTILLVDDVLTTGATAEACAKALKRAGAAEVGIVTFARVGKPIMG
jgi:ComF family protein